MVEHTCYIKSQISIGEIDLKNGMVMAWMPKVFPHKLSVRCLRVFKLGLTTISSGIFHEKKQRKSK